MIEFLKFSWVSGLVVSFILGIAVLTQTLAVVFNFYRTRLNTQRIMEIIFEILILCQILVFSLLHGQIINAYNNGFLVPTGYEKLRILLFLIILIIAVSIYLLKSTVMPLMVIPVISISLPFIEKITGSLLPWLFITALFILMGRSIIISIISITEIKNNISALSIINAVDTLHTGVLFSEQDGYTLLSNHQMQKIMIAITGKIYRNSIHFYETLISAQDESRYKKVELDGQMVYILKNGTAWMFTKTDIPFRLKNYIHISAADVTEYWSLTSKLQIQDEELRLKSIKLKDTIANLQMFCREKEIDHAKIRAHDILGQRLSLLLRILQNKNTLDYDLLRALSKGLLEELKEEQMEISPQDEVRSIQNIFSAIGVDIKFEGSMPQDSKQACLFADIIREGSTNAVRHGFATQINIKVIPEDNKYNLTMTNNGYTTRTPFKQGGGIGVMKKKVNAQGGNLEIVQHPVFTLSVVLPGGEQYD